MTAPVTNLPAKPRSVLIDMAERFGMEPAAFEATVRATCLPPDRDNRVATREEFAAFLLVCKEYELNPLLKEIYGFRTKNGAIVPVVSVDGWANIINSNPALDGIEFDDHLDEKKNLTAITARIWRKDRSKPTVVTEYMIECRRDPEKTPWGRWPRRMLRHKALIQCARYAFGLCGIVDQDEAERMGADVSPMRDVTPRNNDGPRDDGPPPPPPIADDDIKMVESGRDNGDQVEWKDDGMDIPAALDRRNGNGNGHKNDEPAPDFKSWLNDVSGAFSSCETLEQFAEAQRRTMAPQKGKVSKEAWAEAQKIAEETYQRVKEN